MDFTLPGDYLVGVLGESQTQGQIRDEDTYSVAITEHEAVQVTWLPATQAVSDTLSANFTLIVTNSGNVNTDFALSASATPSADVQLGVQGLPLPSSTTAYLPVSIRVIRGGTYELEGTAVGGSVQASDTATLTVLYDGPGGTLYLPFLAMNSSSSVELQPPTLEAVEVAWAPPVQAVTNTLTATFTLVMTNTGDVSTTFYLSANAIPSADVQLEAAEVSLAPLEAKRLPVMVQVEQDGTYVIEMAIQGTTVQLREEAALTVTTVVDDQVVEPAHSVYLPYVIRSAPGGAR
jgi:hypothetical protein